MTDDTEAGSAGASVSMRYHFEQLREADLQRHREAREFDLMHNREAREASHDHFTAVHEADLRYRAALREADLRAIDLSREAAERALQIKEEGDAKALTLARDIQTYKDEKANELRSQIESERGTYATKEDVHGLEDKFMALLTPVGAFMANFSGQQQGTQATKNEQRAWLATVLVVLTIVVILANNGVFR